MPIRLGTQADLENIKVIKPVNNYGQLGSGSGEVCNCVTSPCDCEPKDTEPQVVFGNNPTFSRTRVVKPTTTPITVKAPPREPMTGKIDKPIIPDPDPPTTPPADDKIFGFPRWLVIGGGVAAGLYFLSQMSEVK